MTSGTATVLFTDLVGSTELMATLGDAAFDRLRGEHFARLRECVAAHGGTEVKNTGDGVLATFPSAVEAVAAAVAMQQATDRQARSSPAPLAIRIGLSIGEVGLEDGDVFGTPVVEAARLVAAARPGQILATTLLRAMAGTRTAVAFTDLGAVELKGLPDPVAVCEVGWEPSAEAVSTVPLPNLLTGTGRIFVGREEEFERLRRLWKETCEGERRLVLLGGEPGIGKTRLAAELAAAVHGEGGVVLAGRCDEDLGVPYQPFVEALRHFVGGVGGPAREFGRYGGELARLVPEIAERVAGLAEPLRSDPETERYRLFDAVAAWLGTVSGEQPVLLILDDLHWAAKPTLLLLRHALRAPEPMRLLVLGTYRDTELSRTHPLTELLADLRRTGGVERIALSGLDTVAVAAFLEQAAGHDLSEEGEDLARAVRDETEGNPFFVAEVLRLLTETGAIERRDGRWVTAAAIEELGIPEGVRDVVGRRLARLSGATNQALTVASVVGAEFEPVVIEAAGDLAEADLLAALDEAVAARLVVDVPGAGLRYRFAHALVRVTLYEELTAARRVVLHRRVAAAIEAVHLNRLDDYLPALAHHYARAAAPAAETGKAVEYAARAGDRALAQLAHDEAVTFYRQALELLAVAGGPATGQRLELMISLGEAERRAGDPAHRQTLLDASRLARELGDAGALARAALANTRTVLFSAAGVVDHERVEMLEAAIEAVGPADSDVRARLLARLGIELHWTPERERRVSLSDEALAIARRLGDPATLASVLVPRYATVIAPDNLDERQANVDELAAAADLLADPVMACLTWSLRFRVLMETAQVAEADVALESFTRLAGELGQPLLRWMTGWARTNRLAVAGRLDEAEQVARETRELGVASGQGDADTIFAFGMFPIRLEQGRLEEWEPDFVEVVDQYDPDRMPFATAVQALIHCELGREGLARSTFEPLASAGLAAIPLDVPWMVAMTTCADVAARLGDAERAAMFYEALRPYADRLSFMATFTMGPVAFHLGLLSTILGRFDEGESHFAAAEATNLRIGAPAWLARTRTEWAAMLLRRAGPGDAERARGLLGQALTAATEFGLIALARRAGPILEEAG